MNKNEQWALVIAAVSGVGYLAYRRGPARTMSLDEQEALAPAPYSTEGGAADNLTPADYYTEGRTVAAQPYSQDQSVTDPSVLFLPLTQPWEVTGVVNSPDHPGGHGGNYGMKEHKPTRELTLATWNTGHGTPEDALSVAEKADATGLQETGDRAGARVKQTLRRHGYGIVEAPHKPGSSSTPLVYDRKVLTLLKPEIILTSRSQEAGPGAGPDVVKTKWLVGGVFWHKATNRRVRIYSVHYVASSYTSIRERIAIAQSKSIARAFQNSKIPVYVVGDFNAVPGDNVIAPLYRAGWTNDQRRGHELATHGNRAIDYVWFKKHLGTHFLRHFTMQTHGDHRADIAVFRL